nr:tetratricopeptide repeat protein [Tatlockia sp.]
LNDFTLSFEKTNKRNSNASFNIGKCYFGLGNLEKAIEFYKTTLTLEPNDKYSFYELGYCYASLPTPDKDNALKYYTKAIDQDKNYYDPFFNRGLLYATQFKNLKKGHADLERSIEIRPKNKLSYLYNGMLYRDEEEFGKAKDMFNKVIELYPNYAEAYFERAVTWYKIGILNMVCKDLDKAESLGYTKATETKKQVCK